MKTIVFGLTSILSIYGSATEQVLEIAPEYSKAGYFEIPFSGREVFDFNVGWRFYKGAMKDAEKIDFDDSKWDVVSTPHGLELISSQASGSNNYQGEAWYRKHFTIPGNIEDKRLVVYFESVMGKSKVWLNGELLTTNYGGYLPFSVDITGKFKKGEKNVISVWADNSDDPNYPPGKSQSVLDFCYFGGIYRDVWLVSTNDVYVTDPNHVDVVAGGGVFIHFDNLSEESVNVIVKTNIASAKNKDQSIVLEYILKDSSGNIVSKGDSRALIPADSNVDADFFFEVKKPELWSPKRPYLYNLEICLIGEEKEKIDGVRKKIGIRKIEFRGKEGFYLNNKPYEGKLIGANRHQDYGYVGNALPNSGQWRDALILKAAGCEVIRAAHYPADPAFMDACDALGLFFIVATPGWQFWNDDNPQFEERVYRNIREMARRDRNYASVLLWEPILNETHYPDYFAKNVHDIVHEEYPYQGAFTVCDSAAKGMEYFDVVYNHPQYADNFKVWEPDPQNVRTDHIMFDYSGESRSVFTREWGDNVDDWNAHNSTSRVARGWGESPQLIQANHYADTKYRFTNLKSLYSTPDQHVGGALWHAFDHQRGYHPDPFYGGITDIFRQPKYSYYMFKAQQSPLHSEPMVYVAHEMSPFSSPDVTVFTNCDEVRLTVFEEDTYTVKKDTSIKTPGAIMLFKNAFDFMAYKSLYRKKQHSKVIIVAEGIIDGKVVVKTKKVPVNRKTKIKLEVADLGVPLTANGSDFITVIASIVDDNGNVKRLSKDYIRFEIEGEGNIIGDSDIMANPVQTEWGTAPLLVRSTLKPGKITIRAFMLDEGINTPLFGELSFDSVASNEILLYTDEPEVKNSSAARNDNSNSDLEEILKRKIRKLENEINQIKVKQTQKQQEEFEGVK